VNDDPLSIWLTIFKEQRDAIGKSISCRHDRRHYSHDFGLGQVPPSGRFVRRMDIHKAEGYLFTIVLRLAGACLWISTFAYLLFPESVQWAVIPIPDWLRWIGIASGAVCSILMYSTLSSLGQEHDRYRRNESRGNLGNGRPYRWVRHPFHVTAALFMTSATALTANWLIGFNGLVVLARRADRCRKRNRC
jgi:protein-S-isoprenylcysteine O-methyltransferase Ste14